MDYYKDYQELFSTCKAYYSGEYGSSSSYLNDFMGSYTGTILGSPLRSTDRFGTSKALVFASGKRIRLPYTLIQSSTFSIIGWVDTTNQTLSTLIRGVTAPRLFAIYFSNTYVYLTSYTGSKYLNTYLYFPSAYNGWVMVAFTINAGVVTGYLPQFDILNTGTFSSYNGGTDPYGVGNDPRTDFNGYIATSGIHEIFVFNNILSRAEIYQIYNITRNKVLYPIQSGIRGVE